jgi:hypothetical protein
MTDMRAAGHANFDRAAALGTKGTWTVPELVRFECQVNATTRHALFAEYRGPPPG